MTEEKAKEWIRKTVKRYAQTGDKQAAAEGREVLSWLESTMKEKKATDDLLFERGTD